MTSVAFRPSIYNGAKVINLSYANDRLDYVEYISGNSAFRTNFSYNNGLVVKHYSGVDYHIENAEDYIVYSADNDSSYSDSYSQKLTCNKSTDSISVKKRIGTKLVDTTTYQFYELNESERFKILEITDKHGIKTRIQYEGNIPKYSYEYTGEISPHYTKCYSGTVSIYKENEVIGTQTYDSGIKMTNIAGTNNWTANVNLSQATEDCYFILSGWILTNHLPQCELTISDNFGNQVQSTITDLGYNAFRYFTAKFDFSAPESITVSSNLGTDNMLTRDFRISVNKGGGITDSATNHFTLIDEVLIPEQEAPGGHKEFPVAITGFYNGNNQILQKITYNDILRYKINQRLGAHPNEIYYDGGRGIISNAGEFRIKYRTPSDGEDIIIKIDDLAIGKNFYKNGNKHTQKTDFSDNLGYPNLTTRKYTNGRYYEQIFYDDKLNEIIVFENDYSSTILTKNEKGLTTTKAIIDLSNNNRIETHYTYDDNNTKLLSATDEFGNVTTYVTDDIWGVVTGTVLPDGTIVTDEYDKEAIALVSKTFAKDTAQIKHTLSYSGGNLSNVAVGTLNYGFNYTAGDLTEVTKFGDTIENHLLSNDDKALTTEYHHIQDTGRGNTIVQRKDNYGRLLAIDNKITNTYDVNPFCNSNSYNILGIINGSAKLAASIDLITNTTTKYAYDKNILSKVGIFDSTNTKISEASITYDNINRVISYDYLLGAKSIKETTDYITSASSPNPDERISNHTLLVNESCILSSTNTYDAFKRLIGKQRTVGNNSFTKNINYDKTRINSVYYSVNDSYAHKYQINYDDRSRIVSEYDEINGGNAISYVYDFLGRLIRENNQSLDKTIVYQYNDIGGLTRVREYEYTTGDVSDSPISEDIYTYNPYYPDTIKSINDKTLYFNYHGFYGGFKDTTNNIIANYIWKEKYIKFIQYEESSTIKDIDFEHDAYGKRIKKIYTDYHSKFAYGLEDIITHNYDYDTNGRLTREKISTVYNNQSPITDEIDYLYEGSDVIGMIHTIDGISNTYVFDKNYKGDVVGIYDSTGTIIVKYAYDAWGKCTILNGSNSVIANINPFRYRSYYFDSESGLYYLNARYYDPSWRIFISHDSPEYLNSNAPCGLNLNAYCNNDPVNDMQNSSFSGSLVSNSSITVRDSSLSFGSSVGSNLGVGGNPSAPWWASTAVGAIPDFILGMRYLAASGMHSRFAYVTNKRYMHPIMGGTWRWFGKSNSSFRTVAHGTFNQILTGDARASFGAVAKSVGGVVGLNALVNFGFNLYENNWQIDSAMLMDTAIDTAIGVSSYYLAAGAMSLAATGLLVAGVTLPGVVVVGGVVVLSIGFEHVIREISGYWN